MKKSIKSLAVPVFILFSISTLWGYISDSSSVTRKVERGVYITSSPIQPGDLKHMPIPYSNEDYALLQSIDNVSNIVIGLFANSHRRVVLIQDSNSDGRVDLVVTYYVDRKQYRYSTNPTRAYPREKFKKLKEDILSGRQEEIRPNSEGIEVLKNLQKNSSLVKRWKNGFRILLRDEADEIAERINFYASTSTDGADLIYQLNYRHRGVVRISPIINYSVFCKNSKDKYIIDMTRQIVKNASFHNPHTR